MAMSLEDLLAEEGFKRRKAKPRASFASEGGNIPPYTQKGKKESGSLLAARRTERTRSDIPKYDSKGEFSASGSFTSRKPRDNNFSRMERSEKGKSVKMEKRGLNDSWDPKRFSIGSSQDLGGLEIIEVVENDEIVEVGSNRRYKDIYSNKVYCREGASKKHNVAIDNKTRNSSLKHHSLHGFDKKISENDKVLDESRSMRENKVEEAIATPALDEAAVKAIISILSGYMHNFAKDEEFRMSLHHNTFSSLNLIGIDQTLIAESKIIENLEQAIEIAERAAEERATVKEVKKASLQLSVITGLNSNDLKDGQTSGISNFKLSACAHLYLSVIYVLQKKERIAAKHILQVFCDSPLQARTALLPNLWERVFLPHFSHLKLWYDKETHTMADSPIVMNLKHVEKVYNENLDSGTCQFSKYYKDWIAEGVEAPSLPLIKVPSVPVQLMPRGGLHGHASSPVSHFSPQPIVSKKLYDEMFRHSRKSVVGVEIYEEESFGIRARSSYSPATEDKQLILYSNDSVTRTNQNFEPDGESPSDDLVVADEVQRFPSESSSVIANAENLVFELKHIEESVRHPATVQEQQEEYEEDFRRQHSLSSIPRDFLCPLTGLLFEDPVTLETGQTYEKEAITDWFSKGFITCPVSRKTLKHHDVPPVNHILKRVIDKWKIDHFDYLLSLLSQAANGNIDVNDDMLICIFEQLLTVFSKEERIINARKIISFGGMQFLLRRFDCGNTQEKTFILPLLCCCIEADAGCRNDIARNINQRNLLELLHSEQLKFSTNAVLLLTELICLNRKKEAKLFLERLRDEDIINAMNGLLVYLQTCPLDQTPHVAVLLLHLDLMSDAETSDVYKQEAVDALTISLERSFSNEKLQKKCCKVLLILGGVFSPSGKLLTEDWILKLAGFLSSPDRDTAENEANETGVDETVATVDSVSEDSDEENAREKWLVSLSTSLLVDGKKPFLNTVSRCLSLGNSDLVRVCLITVAWLSSSLASLTDQESQVFAFSVLISPLKQCLQYGELAEHKALAALSLLNFSTIRECRVMLMDIADEIDPCLENLAEVTWTARELSKIISGERR